MIIAKPSAPNGTSDKPGKILPKIRKNAKIYNK